MSANMEFENKLEKFIINIYNIGCVKFGEFKVKVGISSPVYFDFRTLVSYPKLMDELTDIMVEVFKTNKLNEKNHVCGVPYTALPLASLVSLKLEKSMLVKRKEAKGYGTKKMIEGFFKSGDECIIIEDVITSGSSLLETCKELHSEGIIVKDAVILLDRQQGGRNVITRAGVEVYSIMNVEDILRTLLGANLITDATVSRVKTYLKNSQVDESTIKANETTVNRTRMPFFMRQKASKNPLTKHLFELMESKKTMLCVAADVNSKEELIDVAKKVGNHICILKVHCDAVSNFDEDTHSELCKLSKEMKFLLMEDRKFADIGNTVSLQYSSVVHWADFVTAHSLPGEGVILGLKSAAKDTVNPRGCFLVAQLSCEGSLINDDYTKATLAMAENHSDYVVGLVCQSPNIVTSVDLIQLTPGVSIDSTCDGLKQQYNTPEEVVINRGADVVVVGRGIVNSNNMEETAELYKERLWNAYLERIT